MKPQNEIAYKYGRLAYENGAKRIPYHDSNLMNLLSSIEDHHMRINLYNAWFAAWDNANLSDIEEPSKAILLRPQNQ